MAVILPQALQQGIQESLPIIPNNGNPGGANNMPASAPAEQAPAPDPYAWLQPSPHMDSVGKMLEQYSQYVDTLYEDLNNPQNKELFNPVIRNGQWHYQPLNDFGLPLGNNDPTFPMRQEVPILPGE